MLNLIFDGANLFQKVRAVHAHMSHGAARPFDDPSEDGEFVRKVAIDLGFACRQFGGPRACRQMIVVDDRSWRRDIKYREGEGGYKSNRVKDESTCNWERFYKVSDEALIAMQKNGMIVSRIPGAEGDDLMALWAERLNAAGQDVVLVTSDSDMWQLVRHGTNFTVIYNGNSTTRKVVARTGFRQWSAREADVDIFDAKTFSSSRGRDLVMTASEQATLVEVDPWESLFDKVVMGDGGDGVPSILRWPDPKLKSGVAGITPARCRKVRERVIAAVGGQFPVQELASDPEKFRLLVAAIVQQYPNVDVDPDRLAADLQRNITLVWLDRSVMPAELVGAFDAQGALRDGTALTGLELLVGSRFVAEGSAPKSMDIFKQLGLE